MNYFNIINDSIEFIENEIKSPISLDQLADRVFVSKYHFIRVFQALTNKTPKDYVDERKLTEAAKILANSSRNIVDIAFEFGFESHEAFTRRFKSLFGATPVEIKRGIRTISGLERIEVVERDFTNNNNKLFPSFTITQLEEQLLIGRSISFDPNDGHQLQDVTKFVLECVERFSRKPRFDRLYGVVQGETAVNGRINYFSGIELSNERDPGLDTLVLPSSEYAVFTYIGDMSSIYEVIFTDVCKAMLLSGKQLNQNSVELFELYEKDYDQTKKFSIYIPVK